jgi:hypothetical protein
LFFIPDSCCRRRETASRFAQVRDQLTFRRAMMLDVGHEKPLADLKSRDVVDPFFRIGAVIG